MGICQPGRRRLRGAHGGSPAVACAHERYILGSQRIGKVRKGARLIGAATVHGAESEKEEASMNEARGPRARRVGVATTAIAVLTVALPVSAYVGPGAGLSALGSLLALLAAVV